ncbi:type IX secretion system protein PorQ [Flavobacteriales bacterium]|nr:type IX secretion system protein PorQ [Flavobacteriales bacterium]
MIRLKVLIILILTCSFCFSQQVVTSYSILNNNCTARNSSLGGYPTGVFDSEDASIAIFLPSNLLPTHDKQLVINYNNHFADSDFGMLNYSFKVKEKGIFSASLFYNNYGNFQYYTPSGTSLGNSFTASDWIFQLGHSKKLSENIQIGVNLKFLGSVFEQYKSFAIGSDISFTYFEEEKQIGGYLLLSNIGTSIKSYQESTTNNKLPFNSVLGINTKLKHAPIRFHFSYHHLNRWSFYQNSQTSFQSQFQINQLFSNFFNHIIIGTEFLFSKNFNMRFGYDFLSRNDLQPESRPGTSGISWGVGFKVKSLKINYSNSKYHFAGTSNNITIIKQLKSISNK